MDRRNRRYGRHDKIRSSNTIGLIVEGDSEFYALPRLVNVFPGRCSPLRAINLGGLGSHMIPAQVAKRVAGKVRVHLAAGRKHVVVCIDREQREECPGTFAKSVLTSINATIGPVPNFRVDVVVADRTFETWLLAGADGLFEQGFLQQSLKRPHCFEGELGEQGKKGVVELSRLLGRPYSKTGDGPRLFEKLDFQAARDFRPGRRGSRSLDKFLRTLNL
jgi:hypothetical protein